MTVDGRTRLMYKYWSTPVLSDVWKEKSVGSV